MIYTHEPEDYDCPFCRLVRGQEDEINKQEYIVYQDSKTIVYIAPTWWKNNPGHVLVISKEHVENLYDIPDDLLASVYCTVKKVAVGIKKTYKAEGITTRQHIEPAGDQDVWHFHVHVFARFNEDELNKNYNIKKLVEHKERIKYVNKLKKFFTE